MTPSRRRETRADATAEERRRAFVAGVRRAVARIPRGRVASYGTVAALAGSPGAARAAGRVMAGLDEETALPWWRVVGADGSIRVRRSGGGARLQEALLADEGIRLTDHGRVPVARFGWDPDDDPD